MAGLLRGAVKAKPMPEEEEEPAGGEEDAAPMEGGEGEEAEPPEGEEADETEGNASPEEQAQYEQFVNNGFDMLYDKERWPAVVESLKGDGDPIEGLANVVANVVVALVHSAQGAEKELSADVVFQGGIQLLEDLADRSAEMKIHKFTPKDIEAATYRALDHVREMLIQSGAIDREELQAEFAQVVEADRAGQLDQMVPGIGGMGKEAPAAEEEPAPEEDEEGM